MESLSSRVGLEETSASSPPSASWPAECTFSNAAVTYEASPPSLDTGKHNERHQSSSTARSACLQCIPCDDHGTQMKPSISGVACGKPTLPAPEVVGHDAALPTVGPQGGGLGTDVSTEYVVALQDAGQFNMWEPVLRKVLPSQEHSLLLGQICFDVTDGDQRGSWLLPEELLAEWIASAGEDHEDRQIFTNTPVSEEEQDAIEQVLLQLLESQEEDVENTASRDPSTILGVQPVWLEQLALRYLYSCSFDTQKTFDLLQSTLSFRRQQLPVLESEVYYELRSLGACYWHGRDRKLRPLLVVSLQRLQQLQRDGGVEEKVTRLIIFCLEFFLRYLCVAGKVESWCILCDLSGISISSFPLPLLFKLMQLIQGSYRGRLYRFYILHAPRLFHFVAKPLVASLPSTTAKKFRVFTSFDEWQQERRAQFASHQIEKKFGGTAPDVTENWYPFRFYPGPFDPEVESSPSAVERGVVRWDSEPALHTRVHPVVHCGISLHTSILRSHSPDRSSSLFRYAAWLHHLPELQLAPATVAWAKNMLRGRMVEHHGSLADYLLHRERVAQVSKAENSSGEAREVSTLASPLSPTRPRSVSQVFSPTSVSPGTSPVCSFSTALGSAEYKADAACSSSGQQTEVLASQKNSHRTSALWPGDLFLNDETGGTAPSEAVQNHAPEHRSFGAENAALIRNSTAAQSTMLVPGQAERCVRSPQKCAGEVRQHEHGTSGPSVFCSAGRTDAPSEYSQVLQEDLSESAHMEVPSDQIPKQAQRASSPSKKVDSFGTLAHDRAKWAAGKSFVLPETKRDDQLVFRFSSVEPLKRTTSKCRGADYAEDSGAVCCLPSPAGCTETLEQQELYAEAEVYQSIIPRQLQHPDSPLSRSVGGSCRTVSLPGASEGALGSPSSACWHNTPKCERTPKLWLSSSDSFFSLSCDAPREVLNAERLACAFLEGRADHVDQSPISIAAPAPISKSPKKSMVDSILNQGSASHRSKLSRTTSSVDLQKIRIQGISHFISPVAAEPSPCVSTLSATESSISGSCVLCEGSVNCQELSSSRNDWSSSQRQGLADQLCGGTGGGPCVSAQLMHRRSSVATEQQSKETAGIFPESETSRVRELRRLRRVVRALCNSVSGNHRHSERRPAVQCGSLDQCDSSSRETRPRQLQRRYTRKKLHKTEVKHQLEKYESEERPCTGLRRRFSCRLLPQTCPAEGATVPGNILKPANGTRRHRKAKLYRKHPGVVPKTRFPVSESTLRASESDCELCVGVPSDAKLSRSFFSTCGTSRRIIRLPVSLSDRVRRGTLGLARRMQGSVRRKDDVLYFGKPGATSVPLPVEACTARGILTA